MQFHLSAVFEGEAEQDDTDNVAEDLLAIGSVALSQFIGRQNLIVLLGSFHELLLDIVDSDEFTAGDALLEDLDKLILILVVVTNNLGLDRPQEQHHRDVDGRDEKKNNEDGVLVGGDEVNGGYQNYQVLVNCQNVVPHDKDLLVVMVELVGQFDRKLRTEPGQTLVGQSFESI